MRFEDNNVPFPNSKEELSILLKELNKEGKKNGMKMNMQNMKIMCNAQGKKCQGNGNEIENETIGVVEEYIYRGQLMKADNEKNKKADRRITAGWQRFGQYSEFTRKKPIPLSLKNRIMDGAILPTI